MSLYNEIARLGGDSTLASFSFVQGSCRDCSGSTKRVQGRGTHFLVIVARFPLAKSGTSARNLGSRVLTSNQKGGELRFVEARQ